MRSACLHKSKKKSTQIEAGIGFSVCFLVLWYNLKLKHYKCNWSYHFLHFSACFFFNEKYSNKRIEAGIIFSTFFCDLV